MSGVCKTNVEKSKDGVQEWDFKAKDGGGPGPKQVWQSDQQNKLSAAMKWLEAFTTDQDKGITPVWNDENGEGEIIFWENPAPSCQQSIDWCGRTLGTYVVNGGNCAPVIRFTPSAKWVYIALAWAGGVTSKTSAKNIPLEGRDNCDMGERGAGSQLSTPAYAAFYDQVGFGNDKEMQSAQAAHDSANKRVYSMEAELVIQGDPDIAGSLRLFGRTVSLVVISPFHIEQAGRCGEWLAKPGCHPVYSNKAWWVKGVDHMIKEGSYITTLKLALMAPGSDIDTDDEFGGKGSGGWQPGN
jgi:hypothetical protein